MIVWYFAYGSNMNVQRVVGRGIEFDAVEGAALDGVRLSFDKASSEHPGVGHACIVRAPGSRVEGVAYRLREPEQILRMDPFEHTPVNYSREVVRLTPRPPGTARETWAWTYVANPAVQVPGLRPSRSYLEHLLAGRSYLSPAYYQWLLERECAESE